MTRPADRPPLTPRRSRSNGWRSVAHARRGAWRDLRSGERALIAHVYGVAIVAVWIGPDLPSSGYLRLGAHPRLIALLLVVALLTAALAKQRR